MCHYVTGHMSMQFESEMPYVPFFWDDYLNGGGDDDGERLKFKVTKQDRNIFPELKGKRTVVLWESDSGFVMEV